MMIRRSALCLCIVAMLLAACTSGDDDSTTAATDTGPAPGVTDDAVKVGVLHVDQDALQNVGLTFDLGDHEAVYTALFDDLNANGGINGRMIDYTILPVDPTATVVGEAECVQLTEDEDVFLVTGFFLSDGVLCPVETHATAVIGGTMTPERLERAAAPWITPLPDHERPEQAVRRLDEKGELDGTVAVFAHETDRDQTEGVIVPTLEELDVNVVEVGISDAPPNDVAAANSQIQTMAARFEAENADTVVLVGAWSANWPRALVGDAYRPRLAFLDYFAARGFATSEDTTDTTILENALIAGGYGPDQARFEEAAMQECVGVLEDAGIDTPAPDSIDASDPYLQSYQAAFQACPDVALLAAWIEAAGENLNYGTLEAAADGLTVVVPGDPAERTYGPPTSFDGDADVFFYTWNESDKTFDLAED